MRFPHSLRRRSLFLALTAATLLPVSTFAQSIAEVDDAGALPVDAQVETGTWITSITGSLSLFDVDMYRITIDDPEAFTASTVGTEGTLEDTRLYLFDADGHGVYGNDDHVGPPGTLRSMLPAPNDSVGPSAPGDYLLAVTSYPRHPRADDATAIFNEPNGGTVPYTTVLQPAAANLPVSSWGGFGFQAGSYEIALTGVNGTLAAMYASNSVVVEGSSAIVRWSTASEQDVTGYDVEVRLSRMAEFEARGHVSATGSGSNYSVRIDDLEPGQTTFRIRSHNRDGSSGYGSEMQSVVELGAEFAFGSPYPNPFATTSAVSIAVGTPQHVRVAVFDLLGRQVASLLDGDLPANETRLLSIDGSGLPAGVYLISARGETFADSHTVTLTK